MEVQPPRFQTDEAEIAQLALDPENPRLPEDVAEGDQDRLIEFVVNTYDSITIARSIALHGYFPSEPLIVVSSGDEYTVVEGNRRLAALKLLHYPELRERLELTDKDEWEELSESVGSPEEIPVIVVPDRRSVAAIIGYRHISGIEPWDSWAKARFIASLVEVQGLGFDQVATEVGEPTNSIRAHYRDYRIIKRARTDFDINTDRAEASFGVFTRAMYSPALRQHIAAPAPSDVEAEASMVPDGRAHELAELLSWLFGDDNTLQVISESRDITKLGRAVGSADGLEILRGTRDLEEAFIAAGGLRDRLLKRLSLAATSLEAAVDEVHGYADHPEVVFGINRCREALRDLMTMAGIEVPESDASDED